MVSVGGYRLVRRLGQGRHCEVWLGHRAEPPEPHVVAVKLYGEDAALERVGTELEALARLSHPHVQEMLDLSSSRGRPAPILKRLEGGTLAQLLSTSLELEAGEAVTLLAPLAAAVAEVHRVGIAHGTISASAVRFDRNGSPTLLGFGAARVVGEVPLDGAASLTPAQQAASAELTADRAALARLANAVLSRVGGSPLVEWLDRAHRTEDFAEELANRLFHLAEPMPVRSAPPRARERIPRRIEVEERAPRAVADEAEERATPPERSVPHPLLASLQLPPWIDGPLSHAVQRAGELLRQARETWAELRRVHRMLAVGGALAILSLVASTAVGSAPRAVPGEFEAIDPATAHASASAGAPAPIETADAAVAAQRLLERREDCLSTRSLSCLRQVHQPGSPSLQADQALIAGLRAGSHAPTPLSHARLDLVDSFGDVVLFELTGPETPPASLLVVRSEAGWLMRSLSAQSPRSASKSASSRRALTAPRKRAASAPSMMR